MKKDFVRPAFFVLTWLFLTADSIAQAPPHATENENLPRISFRVMAMRQTVRDLAFIQDGTVESFSASSSRPTPWMTFRGPGPLNFYRTEELNAHVDPQPFPRPVAHFSPPDSGSWLLLFVKRDDPGPEGEYRVLPIPDQAGTMEEGVRFLNLTGKSLAVAVNKETVRIDPGMQKQINPAPGENDSMSMKIAAKEDDVWKMVSSTVFGYRPGARITYYIFNSGDRIHFKRFAESLPPAEESRR